MQPAGGLFWPDLLKFRLVEEQQRLSKANKSFFVQCFLRRLIMEVQRYIVSTSAL